MFMFMYVTIVIQRSGKYGLYLGYMYWAVSAIFSEGFTETLETGVYFQ